MIIYLVRHGETDWNRQERIQGQEDIPLNEYGIRMAEAAAREMRAVPWEAAFCSPLKRARRTAEILVGAREIPIMEDERLKEIGFGIYEGQMLETVRNNPKDPIHDFLEHPERYCPPETAESFEVLFQRSASFVKHVLAPLEHRYETILVVAHGALNRSIINPIVGLEIKDFWKHEMGNCSISILRMQDGVLTCLEENRVCPCPH